MSEDQMAKEREWAKYAPSEGENTDRAAQQSTTEGVDAKDRSPEYQQAASQAPIGQGDPQFQQAAEKNREFVEDTSMDYNREEERFAKEQGNQQP